MTKFEDIRRVYAESHERYGDTSAALLTPKGRHDLRFLPIMEILKNRTEGSLLDYGCGIGLLYESIRKAKLEVEYTGWDMTPSFIESCQQRFGSTERFRLIEPDTPIAEKFDFVVCSGVFNLATSEDEGESHTYVRERLRQLLSVTDQVLTCDFLSPFVDFKQDGAQHIAIELVAKWLVESGHRRFIIRHDLLPYEFTVVVYKDSRIIRPQNVYESQPS